MPGPTIISSSPSNNSTDVVLGTKIVVGFSAAMDTTTLNETTVSITGPGQTAVILPEIVIAATPKAQTGREYILGAYTFTTDSNGRTVMSFTPNVPFRPNVVYTIMIVGMGQGTSASAKGIDGQMLAATYKWTFKTGDLQLTVPPAMSPLPSLQLPLDPNSIQIKQRIWTPGNDLSQTIEILFPAAIDPTSLSVDQILLSLEPILNDPSVQIPTGLTPTVVITGNKITVTIAGWPLT
jgi:hypothetical protein